MKLRWSIWKTLLSGVVVGLIYFWLIDTPQIAWKQDDPEIKQAERQEILTNIHWYNNWGRYATVIVPGFVLLVAGWLAFTKGRATQKQAAVHTYEVGQSKFAVHEKDLHVAAPLAMGLMTAEQLRQMNAGSEQAFTMYAKMADAQTRQIHALLKGTGAARALERGLPSAPELPAIAAPTTAIPTFHDLLLTGEIAPGKPMILGYNNGIPRHGSFLDIYSAAVAGESGSGKTATILFLIGSALMSMPVRFLGIDPHYPHPNSLGAKTKPLWESGLMTMATFKDDMLKVLAEVQRTIDCRLKTLEADTVPVVLVIDELAFLSKTPIGPSIAHAMERISTEGRKCQVYMLASSQTWLAARTGDSSVVRDTLTSAYVHRIKPKQANLLLQDREEAEKVKKHVKQTGEALLCPVGSDSVIVKIPFTTDADMRWVADQVGLIRRSYSAGPKAEPQPVTVQVALHPKPIQAIPIQTDADLDAEFEKLMSDVSPASLPETRLIQADPAQTTPVVGEGKEESITLLPLAERIKMLLANGVTYGEMYKATGIAKSTMYNFVNAKGNLKPEQIDALLAYLEQRKQGAPPR